MAGTTSSSSSSCTSLASFDDVSVSVSVKPTESIKFLYSYGGKILPRRPDGKLRYVGGDTRVLAVHRSISFSELQRKLRELCGWSAASLRCQLPTEDLDSLVSITSDEDLANLVEEYDLASQDRPSPLKIRAFLLPRPPTKTTPNTHLPTTPISAGGEFSADQPLVPAAAGRFVHQVSVPPKFYGRYEKPAAPVAAGEHRFHCRRHHHHGHGAPRAWQYRIPHDKEQFKVKEEETKKLIWNRE